MSRPLVVWALGLGLLAAGAASDGLDAQVVAGQAGGGRGGRGAAPPRPSAAQTPQVTNSVIVGKVVDGDTGSPISGAVVSLSARLLRATGPGRGNPAIRTITNADGFFVFRDLPAGPAQLTATLTGYLNGGYGRTRPNGPTRPLTLAENDTRAGVLIRLWRYSAISGTVVDEVGEAAVGVTVEAIRQALVGGKPHLASAGSTQTDDRGRYRLSRLPPGEYLVTAPTSTTSVLQASLDELAGMTTAERSQVQRARAGSMAPPFTSGIRVGQSNIIINSGRPSPTPPPPPAGDRFLVYRTVYHPSATSAASASPVRVPSGTEVEAIDLQLQLTPALRVSGVLVDPMGQPAAGLGLRLVPTDGASYLSENGFETATTASGPAGQFTFEGVSPGAYAVKVIDVPRPPPPPPPPPPPVAAGSGRSAVPAPPAPPASRGFIAIAAGVRMPASAPGPPGMVRWADVPVVVGAEDVVDLTVALQPGLVVSGRMEFEGSLPRPAPEQMSRMMVNLQPVAGRPMAMPRAQPASEQGAFRTAGHPPGTYLVTAPSPGRGWSLKSVMAGGRDVSLDPLTLDRDVEGVIVTYTDTPRRVRLTGTVQAAPNEDGTIDAYVVAFPANHQAWIRDGMSARRAASVTAPSGTYAIASLPPGDYLVAAVTADEPPQLQNAEYVAKLVRVATLVTLVAGDEKTVPLRAEVVR